MSSLGLRELGPEVLLSLLEALDGSLALVGVTLGHGSVEDEATHSALVRRSFAWRSDTGRPTEIRVERTEAATGPGIAEVDSDRVVAKVAADPGRSRLEARERAQPRQLTGRVDEEGVVVGDDAAVGGYLLEDGGVVALPQREAQGVRVLVTPLQRQRHLEWMAYADDESKLRLQIQPVGGREAGAWVFEPPVVVLAQRRDRRRGWHRRCGPRGGRRRPAAGGRGGCPTSRRWPPAARRCRPPSPCSPRTPLGCPLPRRGAPRLPSRSGEGRSHAGRE